jgi:3-oxoadipyl-CoA thiolase
MTREVFLCDGIRTPIGRFGGALARVRADDLAAAPIRALMARAPAVDWGAVDEVFLGCANQAGEDNRNVARMAALLAGLPIEVPGATISESAGAGGLLLRWIRGRHGELELGWVKQFQSGSKAYWDQWILGNGFYTKLVYRF